VLQASQFEPVSFKATVIGFGLTKSVGRLAARLLAAHGEQIDDEVGLQIPKRSATDNTLQLLFRDRGLLNVTPAWARFEGAFPENPKPGQDWASEPIKWAVDLLMSIMTIQKKTTLALNLEVTWLIREHSSTAALVEHLGLSDSLGGFFAASKYFEIRGNTTIELPNLFPVDCEVLAGRLFEFEDPENVGVQIKYFSPDKRIDETAPVSFTRTVIDQFFAVSPRVMEKQLEQFFPVRGAT
jgi:hypothetical protein